MNLKALVLLNFIILTVACSQLQHQEQIPKNVRSNPTLTSVVYYGEGEYHLLEGNFYRALQFFISAERFDPKSIAIKERIILIYYQLSAYDENYHSTVIELGEKYIDEGMYDENIAVFLAGSHVALGNLQRAVELYKNVLQTRPVALNYLRYFTVQARLDKEPDYTILDKALMADGLDEEIYLRIADFYTYDNIERAIEILEEAFNIYRSNATLFEYLELLTKLQRYDDTLELLFELKDENFNFNRDNLFMFAGILYFEKYYDYLSREYDFFTQIDDFMLLATVYAAANESENYEIAVSAGIRLIEQQEDFEPESDSYYVTLADLLMRNRFVDKALNSISQVSNPLRVLTTISYFLDDFEISMEDVRDFVYNLGNYTPDDYISKLSVAMYYYTIEDSQKAIDILNEIELDEVNGEEALNIILHLYLDLESDQLDRLLEVHRNINDPDMSENYLKALFFNRRGEYWQAVEYLERDLVKPDTKPPVQTYIFLAIQYLELNDIEKQIRLMEQAVEFYPENPEILNWLGYSLVEAEKRLDEAETLIKKALEINPEAHHIWDSLAWLYYKKGYYDKALEAMEFCIKKGIHDTVIAFHAAKIYLALNDLERAVDYLHLALILNNDEATVAKAKSVLKQLNQKEGKND